MTQDKKVDQIFANYKQESVKFVVDKEANKLLNNPIYRPILLILREGIKTAEEIQEVIKTKEELQKPSLKTIYRHLKALTAADLVVEAGVRKIYKSGEEKPPTTQRLFARTAKFFYLSGSTEEYISPENVKKRAKLLREILGIDLKHKPSLDCLEEFIVKLESSNDNCMTDLFKEHPDELAEVVGEVPVHELQNVLNIYSSIRLLLRKSEFEKYLKECLKIS